MRVDLKNLKDVSAYLDGYKMGMYYDLAATLINFRDADLHEHHGCKSFWQFADKAEIGQRTARYLIDTFEKLKQLGYTEDQMRELFDTFRWTRLMHIAKHLEKRVAPGTLKKKYGALRTAELRSELAGTGKVMFTAEISKAQYGRLIRLLKKKHGIAKGKGHGKVGEAFGKMIDAAYKKA